MRALLRKENEVNWKHFVTGIFMAGFLGGLAWVMNHKEIAHLLMFVGIFPYCVLELLVGEPKNE